MPGIVLAADLTLPVEAVTQTLAILAKRGVGKTTTARRLAEGFAAAGSQFVAVDPVGVWWGLRSSADGKGPGLDIYIFGGEHGDLPLEEGAGVLLADVVLESGASVILDTSDLSEAAMRRFLTDFCRRLYERKGRDRRPLHLILDEADEFAPQRIPPAGAALFGAIDRIVRRGRARGLGCTLISQRPAVVNKDVLTQCEVLVAMRVVHPRDRKALEEWATERDGTDRAREFSASLTSLDVGEAWVWSPGWLDVFQRVRIQMPWTYDSSYTPKPGEARVEPTAAVVVDLDALGKRIAATREQARANDPKHLQARIRELEKQVAVYEAADYESLGTNDDVVRLEMELAEAAERNDALEAENLRHRLLFSELHSPILSAAEAVQKFHEMQSSEVVPPARATRANGSTRAQSSLPVVLSAGGGASAGIRPPAVATPARAARTPDGLSWDTLSKAQRAILGVLYQYPEGLDQAKVALLAGYTAGTGGFNNAVSSLRTSGLIEGRGTLHITQDGDAIATGYVEPLPTGMEALAYWEQHQAVRKVSSAPRLLRALFEAFPEWVALAELAQRCGYTPGTGGFNNGISRLRSLGLAESEPGHVRAASLFFEGVLNA